jgi:hypothetical protein
LKYSACISKNVIVPETKYAKTAFLQIRIPDFVSRVLGVLTAIRLDNESAFERDEINDPWPDRYLPAKLNVCGLPRA